MYTLPKTLDDVKDKNYGVKDIWDIVKEWYKDHDRCYNAAIGSCEYRNKSRTNACAVGLFLPNDSGFVNFRKGIDTDMYQYLRDNNVISDNVTHDFLKDLQKQHDSNAIPTYVQYGNKTNSFAFFLEEYKLD